MLDKKETVREITALVETFCNRHLNDELTACSRKLCDTLGRKRKLNIARGRKEIWAAAIIYTIARLNFLFDKENPCFLTTETICDFFGTKKTTTSNKATLIEQECDLGLGEPGYCTREIEETFSFVQLPNGLILPKKMLGPVYFEEADEEESREIEEYLAEMQRRDEENRSARRERRAEIDRETAEKKMQKKQQGDRFRQPGLFDD